MSQESKPSGLRPPSKIGRPTCTVTPKPAVPPSPPRSINSMEPLWETHGRRLSEAGVRRGSDNSVVLTEDTDSFIIGDHVWVGGTKPGQIAYIGETQFAPGDWAGIVLDEPIGKNDGSVAGCRYFQCEPKRGIFSRLTRLTRQPIHGVSPISPSESVKGSLNKSMSPSLNNSTTSLASVSQKELQMGERVIVSSSQGSKTGVLRYMGVTEFAPGEWCGVELDEPVGKNDGSVADKRYFECRPKYGLFAPAAKVSRSPSNNNRRSTTHRPSGASLSMSLRKAGSRESLASVASQATSIASSRIATGSTSSTARLQKAGLLRTSTPARKTTQDILNDRKKEIETLRKERDLERERVTKAASQADEAEKAIATLKKEYEKFREETEKVSQETQSTLAQLLEEKNLLATQLDEERRKCEDLLFRFEEESISKDDIQVANSIYENKIKDLEKQLSEERERVIQLERDSTKLFEAEEELTKLRIELQSAAAGEKNEFSELQKRNEDLEKAQQEFEKLLEEKTKTMEQYIAEISLANEKLKEKEQENVSQEESKSNLRKQLDKTTKQLEEKCALIDEMQNNFKAQTENLQREIERLKETIKNITEQNTVDRAKLVEEYDKLLKDKEEIIKLKTSELKQESQKIFATQEGVLEQMKAENAKQIQELSESFKAQLNSKDAQIEQISTRLEEKVQNASKLIAQLNELQIGGVTKENEMKKLSADLEELNKKLMISDEKSQSLNLQLNELKVKHEEEIKNITEQKSKLENEVSTLTLDINSLKEQLNELNECVKMKDIELSKMQNSKIDEMEDLKKQFQEQMEGKNKSIQDITADATEKASRLSTLEKELSDLKSTIASKDEEIKNLTKKTSELQDALSLSDKTKTNLESELRTYEKNLTELNEKFSRAEEKINQLSSQKEKLEQEIANAVSTSVDSSDKLVKYNEELRQKEKELDQARDKEFELQKLVTSAETKINSMQEDLNKTNVLVDQMRSEQEEFKSKIALEKQETQANLEKIKICQSTEQELINKNKVLEDNMHKKTLEVSELTQSLQDAQEKNFLLETQLKEAVEKYNNEKSQLEKQVNDTGANEITLKENIQTLEKLNAQLITDQNAIVVSTNELKGALNAKNQHVSELESIINDKDLELKEIVSNLEKIKIEKEEIQKNLVETSSRYNDTLTELTLLKSSNTSLESQMTLEVANLKQQLEDEKNTLDTALKESKKDLDELKKELAASSEIITKTNQKCMEMEALLTTKEKELQTLNENLSSEKENNNTIAQQIKVLQESVVAKDNEILANDNHISSLNESIKNLESNINILKADYENKSKQLAELELTLVEVKKSNEDRLSDDVKEKQRQIDELIKKHQQDIQSKDTDISELKKAENNKDKLLQELNDKHKVAEELIKKFEEDSNSKDKTICELKDAEEKARKILLSYEEKQKIEDGLVVEQTENIKLKDKTIIELQDVKKEMEQRMQNLMEQINVANEKSVQFEEVHRRMEKENKQLLANYNETLHKLNIANENLKNNTNNDMSNKVANVKTEENAKPIISSSDSEYTKLKAEYDEAKGQIDFLNSVIVDMQRKNEALSCKVQVLEMGIPPQEADDYNLNLIEKKMQPPRMFCDICDQFDLHETEDCPLQAQDPEPPRPIQTEKKKSVPRPYCENCEMFGHDTSACEDTETY
ncbi:restin homolog isoform X2 [Nasonia vitripennis]|uniref:CAP-Gly domain-containing protein n=1 Tax=Nasonia vitripennis TaxID=7425 RepID=A0A7M7QQ88_NASVI|nr:restin homolog isoform X2 [Nasonia vitripennis]XP_032452898.1 restin homolog isoform X2 [Nasonia vitripennis]XP_032452899.1 restin homolog isoform X2 [Nasonia vitripennis]